MNSLPGAPGSSRPYPVVSLQAFQRGPVLGRPIALGCAYCAMKEKQDKANKEFAERFGYVVDPRYPAQ